MCRQREEEGILAVRVDREVKEALMSASPDVSFRTPHFEGYAWSLIRLPAIEEEERRGMLEDAWCEAATPTNRRRRPEMWRSDGNG